MGGCSGGGSEYPWRPITMVVPWGVGGGTDRVSRQVAFYLEHELGVPVNVVNATGGRGVTGHARGLRSRPDGYTITMMTVELNMLRHQGLTVVSHEDAEPLYSVNEDAAAIFVPAGSRFENVEQLMEAIAAEPGRIQASGTASGGIWHMALAGLLQSRGIAPDAATWVSINGAEPSLTEMDAGGVDFVCCSLPEARVRLESGAVRCLGVMADERVAGFEAVPTLKEQGIDWSMGGWRGLGVPKGTAPERVAVLNGAMERIVTGLSVINGRTFPRFMDEQGFNRTHKGPDEFAAYLEETDAKFEQLFASPAFRTTARNPIPLMAFPYAMYGLIGLSLAILAVKAARGKGRGAEPPAEEGGRGSMTGEHGPGLSGVAKGSAVNAGLIALAVIGYVVFAEAVGFVVIGGIIVVGLLLRLGAKPVTAIAMTAILVPAVYFLFAGALRVPLPPLPWGS